MTQLSLFLRDKRWRGRRETWVTPEDHFLPAGYAVDVVAEPLARDFVVREHYSGSFPAARLSVGLWGPGPTLVGVAVFSVPMSESVLRRWTGADHGAAVSCARPRSSSTGRLGSSGGASATWAARKAAGRCSPSPIPWSGGPPRAS